MQNLFRRILFQYQYFQNPPWDTGISPPELLEFIQTHGPGRAIDLGCGTGTNMITLAKAGWSVIGVDFAPRAIKIARQKLDQASVRASVWLKDVTKLQGLYEQFDLAFDLGCFHGIPDDGKQKYLDALYRILAPNGFWLMYGFIKSDHLQKHSGLLEAHIDMISAHLTLAWRRDGLDHGVKPSAWFLFQKQQPV